MGRLALALVALMLVEATPAEAAERPCYPESRQNIKETRTFAKNAVARVYKVTRGVLKGSVYGCVFSRPRRLDLGLDGNHTDSYEFENVRLRGGIVAFSEWCACRDNYMFDPRVRVVDLRAREERYRREHDDWAIPTDVVLAASGSVAWIADDRLSAYDSASSTSRTVFRHDAAGEVVLDSGLDIQNRSLRRDRDTVSWLHGDEMRSAPLR